MTTSQPVGDDARIAANAALMGRYLEGHDSAALNDDAVFVDVTSGMRWEGPEAIGGMLDWFYHVAFEAVVEGSRLIVGLEGAALEATFVGRHQGEFAGIPPTGRTVRVPLAVLYDIAGGQITGARVHFAVASFLQQVRDAA